MKMRKPKKTKVQLLLELLRDGTWHLNDELAFIVGYRFGDAVKKARRKGYNIKTERTGVGQQHKYRLLTA